MANPFDERVAFPQRDPGYETMMRQVLSSTSDWGGQAYPAAAGGMSFNADSGANSGVRSALGQQSGGAPPFFAGTGINEMGNGLGQMRENEDAGANSLLQTHNILHQWEGPFAGRNRIEMGEYLFVTQTRESGEFVQEPVYKAYRSFLHARPTTDRYLSVSAVNDLLFNMCGLFQTKAVIRAAFSPIGICHGGSQYLPASGNPRNGPLDFAVAHSGKVQGALNYWHEFSKYLCAGAELGFSLVRLDKIPTTASATAAAAAAPVAVGRKSKRNDTKEDNSEVGVAVKRAKIPTGAIVYSAEELLKSDSAARTAAMPAVAKSAAGVTSLRERNEAVSYIWQYLPTVHFSGRPVPSAPTEKHKPLLEGWHTAYERVGVLDGIENEGSLMRRHQTPMSSITDQTVASMKGSLGWIDMASTLRLDPITIHMQCKRSVCEAA